MQPERSEVVRSSDPFNRGEDEQRPWLVISNDSYPYNGGQYIPVAIATKEYEDSLTLSEGEPGRSAVCLRNRTSLHTQSIPHEVRISSRGRVA
jgi:mRNA-degrading endonuclease toxin of MazEF toxin-antitoxin module